MDVASVALTTVTHCALWQSLPRPFTHKSFLSNLAGSIRNAFMDLEPVPV